jgi:DNA-directed RNA polymerase subunit D
MSIEIIEKDDHFLKFVLSDVSIEMANAFRRIILTEIPVMAVDEVIMLRNDSPLYDEILSHRLGMIPLITDLKHYNFQQECTCGGAGCALCSVTLTCDVTNDTDAPLVVRSGDLISNDPKIVPVSANIPIVKLESGSSLTFEAFAILGRAKDHAKFQSVAAIGYKLYPVIKIDDEKCDKCVQKCIASSFCAKNLFEIATEVRSPKLIPDFWKYCDLCDACSRECPEGAIKVEWIDNKYIFSIESDGVLPLNTLMKKAWEIFKEKIDDFKDQLNNLEIEII